MGDMTRPEAPGAVPGGSRLRVVFAVLILAGVALRAGVAFGTLGIAHYDEHQQYLEQAHRIAFGYGKEFWEQRRGMRNTLYPAVLAGGLKGLDLIGIHSPFVQV